MPNLPSFWLKRTSFGGFRNRLQADKTGKSKNLCLLRQALKRQTFWGSGCTWIICYWDMSVIQKVVPPKGATGTILTWMLWDLKRTQNYIRSHSWQLKNTSCFSSYPGKETTSPNDRTLPQPVLEPNHAQSIPKRPVFCSSKGGDSNDVCQEILKTKSRRRLCFAAVF